MATANKTILETNKNVEKVEENFTLTYSCESYFEEPLISQSTEGSCGYDIRANIARPLVIACGEIVKINTRLKIDMSEHPGLCAIILPRSSSNNLGIANTIGLIDTDYLGNWFVKVKNTSYTDSLTILPNERFCQAIFINALRPVLIPGIVDSNKTKRAEGGDGSTGKI
jgi:deoxyuridine 5'-triphosphate nucleotidohydrolase